MAHCHNLRLLSHSLHFSSLVRTRRIRHHNRNHNHNLPSLKWLSTTTDVTLFDSLSERLQKLISRDDKNLGLAWYTCGPTTYAPAHLGHARTYVCLDIIRRVLEEQCKDGIPPLFVMNITDVDDKILAAAAEQQVDPIDLARKYETEFWKDLDALNCRRPHVVTRVTEHVESHIVPFIEALVEQGMAYELQDGVYFHVQAYNEKLGTMTRYGKLASAAAAETIEISIGPHRQSAAAEARSHKKDPRDFVLWKRKKPTEPLAWPSPWGDGRPGWHIECSAMIEAVQSQFHETHRFLVHAGGIDLKFPHHTNEIAQSEAYRGTGEWIPHWVHTGHLHIDGLKMSKSLKNFISIQEFLAENTTTAGSILESPSDDFRLWCLGLSGSYRGPATFCTKRLQEAKVVRQQLVRFLLDGQSWLDQTTRESATRVWKKEDLDLYTACHRARTAGNVALNNDLDGTEYLKTCLHIVTAGNFYLSWNRGSTSSPPEPMNVALLTLREMLELVGFSERTTHVGLANGQFSSVKGIHPGGAEGAEGSIIDALVKFRSSVRRAALEDSKSGKGTANTVSILEVSDRLRDDELPTIGIEVLDGKANEVNDSWRFCIPRVNESGRLSANEDPSEVSTTVNLEDVSPNDIFRVGRYEGMFSKYNSDGIPTHHVDGSEVSKRAMKKLSKKRDAHAERQSKNKVV
jgi:cysteinyl-tRNA synthetase